MLAAARAPKEKKAAVAKALAKLAPPAAALPLGEIGVKPTSLKKLPVGVHSLAAQMSETAVEKLLTEDLVSLLVDARERDEIEDQVKKWKGTSKNLTPTTLLVRCPRSRLKDLAALASVNYVEASMRLKPHCDLAHVSTGLVRAGTRTVPQRGTGVLVGIVDTGIDISHPAFKTGTQTRIVNYLDQTTGREYSQAQINAGAASASRDVIGHGTHVAGIAAGNGGGSNGTQFEGVAPEADIAVVKTTFDSADIADGVAHIFDRANQRNQPCVVNLSLGGHFGGHDGTSVIERTIDQLSGSGRLVVVSAGNEGDAALHASTAMPPKQPTPVRWVADFELTPRIVQGSNVGLLVVQVWHQHEDSIAIRLRSPNGELFGPPQEGESEFDRGVFLVQCSHQRAVYSGDHTTTFVVITIPQSQWLRGWSIIAQEDRSGGKTGVQVGSIHTWILQEEMGRFTSSDTRSHLVGMPGTAFSAITVASYATRKSWPSRDPAHPNVVLDAVNLEDISYFSSPGPTRDGVNKPEVAAPGQWLISALSSKASVGEMPLWLRLPNVPYASLQGTSMAAPYVTGALALLLEKNPTIDWAEAKRRLIKSVKQDSFTGPAWNLRWGYGKIDVEKLLTVEPA
jgi:subtilisin family serine protease